MFLAVASIVGFDVVNQKTFFEQATALANISGYNVLSILIVLVPIAIATDVALLQA